MWAGVHRVFKDKPGGLVVDYLGLADEPQEGADHLYRKRRQRKDRLLFLEADSRALGHGAAKKSAGALLTS